MPGAGHDGIAVVRRGVLIREELYYRKRRLLPTPNAFEELVTGSGDDNASIVSPEWEETGREDRENLTRNFSNVCTKVARVARVLTYYPREDIPL